MTRITLAKLFGIACLLGLANGCGGGSTDASRTGSIRFLVDWGEPTRLLPAASNSLKFVVKEMRDGNEDPPQELITKVETRPQGASSSEVTISSLPAVKVQIDISAHPDSSAVGVAQAVGSVQATISPGATTDSWVTLRSTIENVALRREPSAPIKLGETVKIIATAYTRRGEIVLTSPGKWTWTLDDPTIATGTSDSNQLILTGNKVGQTRAKALDQESNMWGSIYVNVDETPTGPPLPPCVADSGDWVGDLYNVTQQVTRPNQLVRFRANEPTVADWYNYFNWYGWLKITRVGTTNEYTVEGGGQGASQTFSGHGRMTTTDLSSFRNCQLSLDIVETNGASSTQLNLSVAKQIRR